MVIERCILENKLIAISLFYLHTQNIGTSLKKLKKIIIFIFFTLWLVYYTVSVFGMKGKLGLDAYLSPIKINVVIAIPAETPA